MESCLTRLRSCARLARCMHTRSTHRIQKLKGWEGVCHAATAGVALGLLRLLLRVSDDGGHVGGKRGVWGGSSAQAGHGGGTAQGRQRWRTAGSVGYVSWASSISAPRASARASGARRPLCRTLARHCAERDSAQFSERRSSVRRGFARRAFGFVEVPKPINRSSKHINGKILWARKYWVIWKSSDEITGLRSGSGPSSGCPSGPKYCYHGT